MPTINKNTAPMISAIKTKYAQRAWYFDANAPPTPTIATDKIIVIAPVSCSGKYSFSFMIVPHKITL